MGMGSARLQFPNSGGKSSLGGAVERKRTLENRRLRTKVQKFTTSAENFCTSFRGRGDTNASLSKITEAHNPKNVAASKHTQHVYVRVTLELT